MYFRQLGLQKETSGEIWGCRYVTFWVIVESMVMDDLSASENDKAGHCTDVWSLGVIQTWASEEEHYFTLSCHDYAVMELLAIKHKSLFFISLFFHSFVHLWIFHYTIFKVCDV